MDVELHHCAYRINPDSFEKAAELFKELGCNLYYRVNNERWGLFRQERNDIVIQLIETKTGVLPTDEKTSSHIAFISSDPKTELERIKKWAEDNNLEFVQGSWSETEHWFDIPEFFNDFVIEIMDKSIFDKN